MNVIIQGGKSFSHLEVELAPGEAIMAESGAMSTMDKQIDLESSLNGGLINAFLLRFLGRESFFKSLFSNNTQVNRKLHLTQTVPGEIVPHQLQRGEVLYIQPGAFIAATTGVKLGIRFAGFSSWIAREGLFRLKFSGEGMIWYGAYGAVVEKEVMGDYLVDTGHLLSYPPSMKLSLRLAGGIFTSFFSGEGLLLRLTGKGKIKLQTRSIHGLANWLNPRFRG